jgi:hypothetical protein
MFRKSKVEELEDIGEKIIYFENWQEIFPLLDRIREINLQLTVLNFLSAIVKSQKLGGIY